MVLDYSDLKNCNGVVSKIMIFGCNSNITDLCCSGQSRFSGQLLHRQSVKRTGAVAGWMGTRLRGPPSTVNRAMNQKRKANSPRESLKLKLKICGESQGENQLYKVITLPKVDSSTESFQTAEMSTSSKMDQSITIHKNFSVRVTKKNGEPFEGGLDRPQCFIIWKKLALDPNLLYGIALNQTPDRPFMAKFELNEGIDVEELPSDLKVKIDRDEYEMTVLMPKDPPPKLGENFMVTIKNTKFNITLSQVDSILGSFGKIVRSSMHMEADDLKGVKTDDVSCIVKLRKHIPSFLPGYGRKLMVRYYGQPLQCSKCFNPGHLRRNCQSETVDWMRFVRLILDEHVLTPEQLGSWVDSLKLSATDSVSSDE